MASGATDLCQNLTAKKEMRFLTPHVGPELLKWVLRAPEKNNREWGIGGPPHLHRMTHSK